MPLTQPVKSLIEDVVKDLVVYLDERDAPDAKVNEFLDPEPLMKRIHAVGIEGEGCSPVELKKAIKECMDLSVNMAHMKVMNQLFHKTDAVGILADWVTSVLNTSIYTYELAPVATMIELNLIEKLRQILGWKSIGGTMPPGGSIGNLYGIVCARHWHFPHVAQKGWQPEDKPVFFVSSTAHYSSKKAAGMIGIGYDAVCFVPVDKFGQMRADKLDELMAEKKKQGYNPFCIVATMGTTLTGAIDPIEDCIKIGKKYNVWVHVDGALGGSLLFSSRFRPGGKEAIKGLEEADSFIVNPHKMMGVTLQSSFFLTRHDKTQRGAFATNAQYLFNADKQYDAARYDVGDQVFQCGRHVDCLKTWLLWKWRGDAGMEKYIEDTIATHEQFDRILATRDEFVPLLEKSSLVPSTCFFYVPKKYQKKSETAGQKPKYEFPRGSDMFDTLDKMVPKAKLLMMRQGKMVLTNSRIGDDTPNFWRFVANGATQWSDEQIHKLLDQITEGCEEVVSHLEAQAAAGVPASPTGMADCKSEMGCETCTS